MINESGVVCVRRFLRTGWFVLVLHEVKTWQKAKSDVSGFFRKFVFSSFVRQSGRRKKAEK